MKKITKKFLESKNACSPGMRWVTENNLIGLPVDKFINKLIENDRFNWANWLIVRLMNKKQCVQYAIFAAEQVLNIYEKKYPNDLAPRKAIQAAKDYLDNPCAKTKKDAAAAYAAAAADYAVAAAYAAAAADYAVAAADYAVAAADYAVAASAAAYVDAAAAYAAAAAAYAAAAASADAASADAKKELQIRIITYGLSIL